MWSVLAVSLVIAATVEGACSPEGYGFYVAHIGVVFFCTGGLWEPIK